MKARQSLPHFHSLGDFRIAMCVTTLVATLLPAAAADYYWDSNNATAGFGSSGSGTWGTSAFWSTDSIGSAATASTTTTTIDTVYFGTDSLGYTGTATHTVTPAAGGVSVGNIYIGAAGAVADFTFGAGTITFGDTATYTYNYGGGKWNRINATLAGAGTRLTFAGQGHKRLNTAGTWTGSTTLSQGWLTLANANVLPSTTAVGVQGGMLNFENKNQSIRSLTFSGGSISGTGMTLTLSNGGGTGVFGLNADRTVGCNLELASGSAAVGANSLDIGAGSGRTLTLSGAISSASGNGMDIYNSGAGRVRLSGSYTAGPINIHTGTLQLGSSTVLPAGLTVDFLTAADSAFDLNGFDATITQLQIKGTGFSGGGALINNNGATTSTLACSGGILLTGNASTGGSANIATASTIGDGGSGYTLTKVGTGTLTLTGSSTHGTTAVSAGTLVLGHATDTLAGAVTVSGGTLNVDNPDTLGTVTLTSGTISGDSALEGTAYDVRTGTIGVVLAGTGALTKTTAGTVTLTAASTYSGATTVNAGTLALVTGGSCANSAVTVAATAGETAVFSLTTTDTAQQATLGSLTVDNNANGGTGSDLQFSFGPLTPSTTVAPLNISGAAAFTTPPGITISGSSLPPSAGNGYPLMTWGSGGAPDITAVVLTLPSRIAGNLAIVGNTLYLQITGTTQPLSWTGGDGTWDIDNALNPIWQDSASTSTYYMEGDSVVFDNTLGTGGTVTLDTTVNPSAVTANNQTADYTISGTGGIAGSATLTKSGAGKLVLATTNTNSGATTVNDGTLQVGAGGATGSLGAGAVTIESSGTLAFHRSSTGLAIANAVSGGGALVFQGTGTSGESDYIPAGIGAGYTGPITVTNARLQANTAASSFGNAASVTVQSGGGLGLGFTTAPTIATPITISGAGWLEAAGQQGAIRVENGATVSGPVTLAADAAIGTANSTGGTVSGPIDNAGFGLTLRVNAGTLTASGAIGGTGGLTKTLGGTLTLSGANTYGGGTAHNGGIIVAANDSALGTGTFTMANAPRLVVNDGVTLSNNIILDGGGGQSGRGLIENSGTGNSTLSGGTITINGAAGAGGHFEGTDVGGSLTILDPITSSVTVIQRKGIVIYGGGGSYTGIQIIGTGRLAADNGLSTSASLALGSPETGTFDLAGHSQELAGLTRVANTCAVTNTSTTGDSTLTINAAADSTYSGVLTDGNADNSRLNLVKSGPAVFTLTGANTHSGTTTVSAGTLQLGDGGTTGSLTGHIHIEAGATLIHNHSDALGLGANNLSGGGTIEKTGSGDGPGLSGVNTFSGQINIRAGTLALVGADSENGAPAVFVAAGARLAIGSGFIGGTATIGNLSGAGNINTAYNSGSGTRTLQVNQSLDGTFSGELADATTGRILALTKAGPATLALTGANTYTGDTTVAGGTLAVNGSALSDLGKLVLDGGMVHVTGTEVVGALFFGTVQQGGGTWGATGSGATHIDDTRFAGTGVIQVGGFAAWADANAPGETMEMDHDGDGVPNGIEYFMGQSGSGFTALPGVTNSGGTLGVTWTKGASYAGAYGTDFVVETSDTLTGAWHPEPSPGTVTIVGDDITFTFPNPLGARKFARLKVTGP